MRNERKTYTISCLSPSVREHLADQLVRERDEVVQRGVGRADFAAIRETAEGQYLQWSMSRCAGRAAMLASHSSTCSGLPAITASMTLSETPWSTIARHVGAERSGLPVRFQNLI